MRTSALLRHSAALLLSTVLVSASAEAQVLYNNGPVVDANGRSVIRAGGSVFGFGAQTTSANRVGDDFTVSGASWNVTGFSFFAYQTGAAGNFTFTGVDWRVVSGDPNTGSVVASGSSAPVNGGFEGYRVDPTDLGSTLRSIFRLDVAAPSFLLGEGSYWLQWSMAGTLASGPWQPPTANGVVGNAIQSLNNGAFSEVFDGGSGVELPFLVRGTRTTAVPEPASLSMLLVGGVALFGAARRRRLR